MITPAHRAGVIFCPQPAPRAETMARPRLKIEIDIVDPPPFSADAADGQIVANQAWVRATEILLLAQSRLAAQQQDAALSSEQEDKAA